MEPEDILRLLIVNIFIFTPAGFFVGRSAKGRAIEGAGLGFALGIIGLPLIYLMEDRRNLCPACKSSCHPQAKICKHCRSALVNDGFSNN